MRYSGGGAISTIVSMKNTDKGNIAFVPLAMPLMCGPGAIATIIGMTSLIKHSEFEFFVFLAIACAILATMVTTIFAWRMQRIFWANWADGHRRRHSHRGVFRFRNCVLLSPSPRPCDDAARPYFGASGGGGGTS